MTLGSRLCVCNRLPGDADAVIPWHTLWVTSFSLCPKYHQVFSISNAIVNAKGCTVVDGEFPSLFDHKLLEDKAWSPPPFQILHSRCSINIVDWQPVSTSTKALPPHCQEMKNWPLALQGQLSSSSYPQGTLCLPLVTLPLAVCSQAFTQPRHISSSCQQVFHFLTRAELREQLGLEFWPSMTVCPLPF